jgi:hypothetical protein
MSELPYKLSKGDHRVIIGAVRDNPLTELKAAIDRNYVHVKFTETRGGTELGFRLDPEHSNLASADFEKGQGTVRLAGNLKLDGVPVRCVAEIDLGKLEGLGHLEILEAPVAAAN